MGKIGIVGSGLGLMNGLVLLYVCLVSPIVSSIPLFLARVVLCHSNTNDYNFHINDMVQF